MKRFFHLCLVFLFAYAGTLAAQQTEIVPEFVVKDGAGHWLVASGRNLPTTSISKGARFFKHGVGWYQWDGGTWAEAPVPGQYTRPIVGGLHNGVGVGTASPRTKLHVVGPDGPVSTFPGIEASDHVVIENNGTTGLALIHSASLGSGDINWFIPTSTGGSAEARITHDATQKFLGFLVDGGGPSANYWLKIIGDSTAGTGHLRQINGYYEFQLELGDPIAPGLNGARLYTKDNGSGKTQLCVIFNSGAPQCFATQP